MPDFMEKGVVDTPIIPMIIIKDQPLPIVFCYAEPVLTLLKEKPLNPLRMEQFSVTFMVCCLMAPAEAGRFLSLLILMPFCAVAPGRTAIVLLENLGKVIDIRITHSLGRQGDGFFIDGHQLCRPLHPHSD